MSRFLATVPGWVARDPAATENLADMRREELISIHTSLENLCGIHKPGWKRKMEFEKVFGALAILLLGGCIGGLLALFPYLSTDPTRTAKWEYIAALAVAGLLGIFAAMARYAIHEKEIESIHTVYQRVDRIKKSYEAQESNGGSEGSTR